MSALFTPLRLRDLEIAHRAWVSPMCMYACEREDGVVHAWHAVHYGQFALGGAALIITEATAVLPEGRVTPQDAGIWAEEHVPAWRTVTDAVHAAGGLIAVQLAHAGRKGSKDRGLPGDASHGRSVPVEAGGWQTIGASGAAFGRFDAPRRAGDDDLRRTVDGFAEAARRAVGAGFDAVEIHGAHGYLLHEMLSPATNDRDDAWGGTGRRRLLDEVVAAVRAALPEGMPLLVRLSVGDVVEGGLDPEQVAGIAASLAELGADLVDASSGGLEAGVEYPDAPGYQVPGASAVKAHGVLPVGAVGLIDTPELAEAIVAEGRADAVLLGRAWLRDPHWAAHAARALGVEAARNPRYHRAYR